MEKGIQAGFKGKKENFQNSLRKEHLDDLFQKRRERAVNRNWPVAPQSASLQQSIQDLLTALKNGKPPGDEVNNLAFSIKDYMQNDGGSYVGVFNAVTYENILQKLITYYEREPVENFLPMSNLIMRLGISDVENIIEKYFAMGVVDLVWKKLFEVKPGQKLDVTSFIFDALGNFYSENAVEINKLLDSDRLNQVSALIESLQDDIELVAASMHFYSSLSTINNMEVRVFIGANLIKVFMNCLVKSREHEETLLDGISIFSLLTDSRQDNDEEPIAQLIKFLDQNHFFNMCHEVINGSYTPSLIILTVRCIGNCFSLDSSKGIDELMSSKPDLVIELLKLVHSTKSVALLKEVYWCLTNIAASEADSLKDLIIKDNELWGQLLSMVSDSLHPKLTENCFLCFCNMVIYANEDCIISITNDLVENFAVFIVDTMQKLQVQGSKCFFRGFVALEALLETFGNCPKDKNRIYNGLSSSPDCLKFMDRARDDEFGTKAKESIRPIYEGYFADD